VSLSCDDQMIDFSFDVDFRVDPWGVAFSQLEIDEKVDTAPRRETLGDKQTVDSCFGVEFLVDPWSVAFYQCL
jgi:hypothetical protein